MIDMVMDPNVKNYEVEIAAQTRKEYFKISKPVFKRITNIKS